MFTVDENDEVDENTSCNLYWYINLLSRYQCIHNGYKNKQFITILYKYIKFELNITCSKVALKLFVKYFLLIIKINNYKLKAK